MKVEKIKKISTSFMSFNYRIPIARKEIVLVMVFNMYARFILDYSALSKYRTVEHGIVIYMSVQTWYSDSVQAWYSTSLIVQF